MQPILLIETLQGVGRLPPLGSDNRFSYLLPPVSSTPFDHLPHLSHMLDLALKGCFCTAGCACAPFQGVSNKGYVSPHIIISGRTQHRATLRTSLSFRPSVRGSERRLKGGAVALGLLFHCLPALYKYRLRLMRESGDTCFAPLQKLIISLDKNLKHEHGEQITPKADAQPVVSTSVSDQHASPGLDFLS